MHPLHFVAKRKVWLLAGLVLGALLLSVLVVTAQGPRPGVPLYATSVAGTGFTYQGQLKRGGAPVNGSCNMTFSLWDSPSTTTGQVGNDETISPAVPVVNGLFTVQLNSGGLFSTTAFNGDARWLQIAVLCPGDGTTVTTLPREQLTPAPMALALPGLWTQQNPTSTNLIGGFSGNVISPTLVGATIGGGGASGFPNRAWANYATIGGGVNNIAGDIYATVGGGASNTASVYATIGGGDLNHASSIYATVGGGVSNNASFQSATIGGGGYNTASNDNATVGGGVLNTASGNDATVPGGVFNIASNDDATVGGGSHNTASGLNATVGGGTRNRAIFGDAETVGGGYSNTVSNHYATIGGGYFNTASGQYATIGGGSSNNATASYTTVGGGFNNNASGPYATVSGLSNNAIGDQATVGGGVSNVASGLDSTVSGGSNNQATNDYANVGGGANNAASGYHATIPGGDLNSATMTDTLAAGHRAKAIHQGAFVWADSTDLGDFASEHADQFSVRASGGIYLYDSASGGGGGNCILPASGTNWSCSSDRNLKENITAIDSREVLQTLGAIPITKWNMKGASVPHIGPMAQDFYAAFGLGEDDTHINSTDAQGVALAAIQGLYQVVQDKDAQIAAQQTQIVELQKQNASIEMRLTALEARANTSNPTSNAPQVMLALGMVALLGGVYRQQRANRVGR